MLLILFLLLPLPLPLPFPCLFFSFFNSGPQKTDIRSNSEVVRERIRMFIQLQPLNSATLMLLYYRQNTRGSFCLGFRVYKALFYHSLVCNSVFDNLEKEGSEKYPNSWFTSGVSQSRSQNQGTTGLYALNLNYGSCLIVCMENSGIDDINLRICLRSQGDMI